MNNLSIPVTPEVEKEVSKLIVTKTYEILEELKRRESLAKDYMTLNEVQRYMNVSPNTLSSWITKHGLKVHSIDGKKYISHKTLVEFLDRFEA